MDSRKDPIEKIIVEDLLYEAELIDKELEESEIEIPEGVEEEIRRRLHAQIDEYERKRVYEKLSEEDRQALKIGRELLKDRANKEEEKVVYRKKRKKMYIAVAAVAVLVLAMGVTSIGGAEKIAEMMRVAIGGREVVRVDTEEDNLIVTSETEEAAYQELRDVFGVEPVKIVHWPGKVNFLDAEIDEELQTALLKYEYEGEIVNYFISSHHTESSWGRDVEDMVTSQFWVTHDKKGDIKVKEYKIEEENITRYSADYTHNGLEYFIVGTMKKTDFEYLVKNLIFF